MPFLPIAKFIVLVAFFFTAVSAHVSAGEFKGPRTAVRLEIHNNAGSPLRCQLVLAHFVTQDIAPILPGGELIIALDRDMDQGALIFRHTGGRSMAIENILCGHSGAWSETRIDLDLTGLRSGKTTELRIVIGKLH